MAPSDFPQPLQYRASGGFTVPQALHLVITPLANDCFHNLKMMLGALSFLCSRIEESEGQDEDQEEGH